MSKHRGPQRAARRGRAGALALALGITIIVGGAAVGAVPQLKVDEAGAQAGGASSASIESAALETVEAAKKPAARTPPATTPTRSAPKKAETVRSKVEKVAPAVDTDPAPPRGSGEGRRIVFDQGDQRVWLIDDDGVERTYRVSGSRFENLKPGSYVVQSKSRHATAFDASGTMEYFVRFATGFSEPIGFHSVPRDNDGRLEQTKAQLGQRLSAGCVRQWEPDAIALWDFAPVGTKVVVTA